MRIVYIMPVVAATEGHGPAEMDRRRGILQGWADSGSLVTVRDLPGGPLSIECLAEEYLAVPELLRAVQGVEAGGDDVAIVGCYGDPGVDACREIVRIPVVAPGECSMLVAASLGHRFSIVTVVDTLVHPLERLARLVGVDSKLASVRAASVPVLDLAQDTEQSYRRVAEIARAAISQDRADTLILGCMSMAFLEVSDRLQADLGVPVVNPALVTLKFSEMLVKANLTSSKQAYPFPPKPLRFP
jgi:allantoin racemase